MLETMASLFVISIVCSYWGVYYVISFLKKRQIIDIPNERSNHKVPTPRGAGIVFFITLPFLLILYDLVLPLWINYKFFIPFILLGIISIIDDIYNISAKKRLLFHLITSFFLIYFCIPYRNILLPEFVPSYVEASLAAVFVTYFINAYNFMDGIDGITATNTITTLSGMTLLALSHNNTDPFLYFCIVAIGFSVGFMFFNWNPAKVFLGDTGSTTLGLIVATIALKLAYNGYVIEVILINSYYLYDTLSTILKRIIAKENLLTAHSKHLYQRAVRNGKYSVKQVCYILGCYNIIITIITLFSQ